MFKVVADQLKVSQGWVRCGQCSDVFDASAQLMPHDTLWQAATPDQSPSLPTEAPAPAPVSTAAAAPVEANPAFDEEAGHDDFDPAGWKQDLLARQQRETPALYAGDADADQPPPRPELMRTATFETASDLTDDKGNPAPRADVAASSPAPSVWVPAAMSSPAPAIPRELPDDDDDDDSSALSPDVSFVRDARRKAFWRRPMVRGLLGLMAVVLLTLLTLQAVLHQRDTLVAREPRLAPAMQSVCALLRCEIRAARHIESLVIDGSTFTRLGADAYRLGFVLKNTSALSLQTPSLELTLTDAQDHAVVRRVLGPSQFGNGTALIAGQSELTGQISLRVAPPPRAGSAVSSTPTDSTDALPSRVAGYRVIAFYPD